MLTSKQRAFLRSMAQNIDSVFQIGKSGVTPEVVDAVSDAIEKRELIKITLLSNCETDLKTAASEISERTRSELVQVIGKKIVLYRAAKDPVIILPRK